MLEANILRLEIEGVTVRDLESDFAFSSLHPADFWSPIDKCRRPCQNPAKPDAGRFGTISTL